MQYGTIKAYARDLRKRQTKAEAAMWGWLRNRNVGRLKFVRQYVIQHAEIDGRKKYYIADFYCHDLHLIIEVDGNIHAEPEQFAYDQIREARLREMGFTVIRVTNHQVLRESETMRTALKQQFAELIALHLPDRG